MNNVNPMSDSDTLKLFSLVLLVLFLLFVAGVSVIVIVLVFMLENEVIVMWLCALAWPLLALLFFFVLRTLDKRFDVVVEKYREKQGGI